MSTLQKILLAALVVVLVVLIIISWGSIASVIFAMALIASIPAYLINRFINNDEDSDFTDNDN